MCYILKLEDGCYYVGYTSKLYYRILQHFTGNGAKWTQLHKPIKVIKFAKGNKKLERLWTHALIQHFGRPYVRGASFCIVDDQDPPPLNTFLIRCTCGLLTSKVYARKHSGLCADCVAAVHLPN